MKLETLMWLFPVLFMIHEFEEIVFLKPWIARNRESISRGLPLFSRALAHVDGLSTAAFSLAVAEEFILVSLVTFVSVELELFNLFAGLLIAFLIHLVIHAAQVLLVRRYVPVIITTLLAGVWSMYALLYLSNNGLVNAVEMALFTGASIAAFGVNFMLAHFLASYYDAKSAPEKDRGPQG